MDRKIDLIAGLLMVAGGIAAITIIPRPSSQVEPPACNFAFSSAYVPMLPAAPFSGKRLFLYAGLGEDTSAWSSFEIMSKLMNDLNADGHQALLMPLPSSPNACYFADGGQQYRIGFQNALLAAIEAATVQHGPAKQNIVLGISYGGLHSLIGQASVGMIDAWIANMPVTKLNQLSEFASLGEVTSFDPFQEIEALTNTFGLIQFDPINDSRVNGALTQQFANQLGPGVKASAYPGVGHATTAAMTDEMRAWVNALN
jgi:hypothetical protein